MLTLRGAVTLNNLGKLADRVSGKKGALAKVRAERIAEHARSRVHVITGKTRDSIRVEPGPDGSAAVTAGYGAVYEEYGTSRRPPHPFLTPAAEAERGNWKQDVKELFKP